MPAVIAWTAFARSKASPSGSPGASRTYLAAALARSSRPCPRHTFKGQLDPKACGFDQLADRLEQSASPHRPARPTWLSRPANPLSVMLARPGARTMGIPTGVQARYKRSHALTVQNGDIHGPRRRDLAIST